MARSGLYACIALDGAPLEPRDAAALGFDPMGDEAIRGVDHITPEAVDVSRNGDSLCIFVGRIDDDDSSLAAALGMARHTPPAILAQAALTRFGEDLAAHMPGEWSCLLWDRSARRLRLATSLARRTPVYFQIIGSKVAVGPDLASFRHLGWADGALDEEAMLLAFARPAVRRMLGDRTILRGVRAVADGTVVTIAADGTVKTGVRPQLTAFDWTGDFDSAIAEVERLMRAAMRRRIAGHDRLMCLISGGLDSSIIAWLAATEREAGQSLTLLSSVSPLGSSIPDERSFSEIVAHHLDLPITWLTPDPDAPVYRQSAALLAQADGPMLGPRHYLYDAINAAALADGSTLLLDGSMGEMTVTGYYPLPSARTRLRRAVKGMLGREPSPVELGWPEGAFNPRMAPHRLAALPESMRQAFAESAPPPARIGANDTWGFIPGHNKMMRTPTEAVDGRLRSDFPFRDSALLRRFAGFPIGYTRYGGLDRAVARALLAGHLPDSIRLRPKGTAFSPDFAQRLHRQAEDERARLPMLRQAGIDEWLDLDWLDTALQRVAAGGTGAVVDPMQVQTTALAAEFLYWWFNPDG